MAGSGGNDLNNYNTELARLGIKNVTNKAPVLTSAKSNQDDEGGSARGTSSVRGFLNSVQQQAPDWGGNSGVKMGRGLRQSNPTEGSSGVRISRGLQFPTTNGVSDVRSSMGVKGKGSVRTGATFLDSLVPDWNMGNKGTVFGTDQPIPIWQRSDWLNPSNPNPTEIPLDPGLGTSAVQTSTMNGLLAALLGDGNDPYKTVNPHEPQSSTPDVFTQPPQVNVPTSSTPANLKTGVEQYVNPFMNNLAKSDYFTKVDRINQLRSQGLDEQANAIQSYIDRNYPQYSSVGNMGAITGVSSDNTRVAGAGSSVGMIPTGNGMLSQLGIQATNNPAASYNPNFQPPNTAQPNNNSALSRLGVQTGQPAAYNPNFQPPQTAQTNQQVSTGGNPIYGGQGASGPGQMGTPGTYTEQDVIRLIPDARPDEIKDLTRLINDANYKGRGVDPNGKTYNALPFRPGGYSAEFLDALYGNPAPYTTGGNMDLTSKAYQGTDLQPENASAGSPPVRNGFYSMYNRALGKYVYYPIDAGYLMSLANPNYRYGGGSGGGGGYGGGGGGGSARGWLANWNIGV